MSDMTHLRNKMDEVTIEMVKMLHVRNEIAKEIGQLKKSIGKVVTDETREENLREKVISISSSLGLDESATSKFLNFLLNESIKIQSGESPSHLSIFRKAKSLEDEGNNIIHMEVGEPDFFPPKTVQDALGDACKKGFFRYGQATGMTSFREALANHTSKKFKVAVTPENILVSPGARFSVFSAITTLLNPGDEVIVIEPAWPAYKDCAIHAGVKVRTIHTTLEDRWEPSCDQIRKMINTNTKMIVLNYPNNPTGKILPKTLQDEIVDIAQDSKLYILSDEIYSNYTYADWKSILSYNYDKSIVTQSFSKSYAMTGFRIGYTISSPQIINKMAKLSALCLTNVSEPIQYAAMNALHADTSDNSNIIRSRLNMLIKKAQDMDLEFINPDGAMYLYAKVGCDGADLANNLLKRGLAVAPGEGFGNYKDFIRVSACIEENILMQGMNILGRELNDIR